MIKSFTIRNQNGEEIVLDLRNPYENGIAIKSVTGLGPERASINYTESATLDGGVYNSARRTVRNIVFNLIFVETYTGDSIETVRQRTYRYFQLKKPITIFIETDNNRLQISGYVEYNQPEIFSRQETTQISVLCPDPYFYSGDGEISTVFSNVTPLFEFPFSNPVSTRSLFFGNIELSTHKDLVYDGSADSGMQIEIQANGAATNIRVYNMYDETSFLLDTSIVASLTGQAFGTGDVFVVSTFPGKKFVHLIRNGLTTNMIAALSRNSTWLQLYPGVNPIYYTAETGQANLEFTIKYTPKYEGV